MAALKFSGNIRIAQVNSQGVYANGFIGVVNAQKLELVLPKPDLIQQISNENGTLGQVLSQGAVPKPTECNATFDDLTDQRMLGFSLNGTTQPFSQSSATVVDEAHTAPAVLGDWVRLANRKVSSVVVKDSTGTTTYAAGTDYVVDAVPGFVRIPATSTITAAQVLHISYSAAAASGSTVLGSSTPFNLLRIEGHMQDIINGGTAFVVIPLYQALASGNLDFFGKSMLVSALGGNMLLPPVGSAAYTETDGNAYKIDSLA